MRKWLVCVTIIVLLCTISSCSAEDRDVSAKSETTAPTTVQPEPPPPTYDSKEYWDIVRDEIIGMLEEHNLYISRIESAYPCVQFFVEPGKQIDDGTIVASGLSQEEYKELYQHIKEELHIILDKYVLAKPKTAFHVCDSIVGIYFYDWFIDRPMFPGVTSWQIANYEIDLLEYYHDDDKNYYIRKDGFSTEAWSKYKVYVP